MLYTRHHRLNANRAHTFTRLRLFFRETWCGGWWEPAALVSSRRSLAEAAAAAAVIKARLGPSARFKTGKTGKKKARQRGTGAAATATAAEVRGGDGRRRGMNQSVSDEVGTAPARG